MLHVPGREDIRYASVLLNTTTTVSWQARRVFILVFYALLILFGVARPSHDLMHLSTRLSRRSRRVAGAPMARLLLIPHPLC
jgi:hypothetical protein